MHRQYILLLTIFFPLLFFGSNSDSTRYKQSQVLDADYGIVMYEKYNIATGGDSARQEISHRFQQGWAVDKYENEQILHKGYYADGHLIFYKNYFENGQLERSFKALGGEQYLMQIFYEDGKERSSLHYKKGAIQKEIDYYPNGKIDYYEEYHKSMKYILSRKSYNETGQLLSEFKIIDKKNYKFKKTEYYENGTIKEEGTMTFIEDAADYLKEGLWKEYDEKGFFLHEEVYVHGQLAENPGTNMQMKVDTNYTKEEINSKEIACITPKEIEVKANVEAEEKARNEALLQADELSLKKAEEARIKMENEEKEKNKAVPITVANKLPEEFNSTDRNKDGKISAKEISDTIDDFFDDKNDFTPERIHKLIDYFFDHD